MARGIHETQAITSYVSTRWYRAPEILMMSKTYSTPADIFAIGCIFGEMHTGKPLFPGFDEVDQLRKIFSVMGTPTSVRWQEGVELLEKAYRVVQWPPKSIELQEKTSMHGDAFHLLSGLLRLNPQTRLTAAIALKHSLFQRKKCSPVMTTTMPITTPTGKKKLPVAVTVSPKSKLRFPLH